MFQKLKTIGRRHIDEMITTRNFKARNESVETGVLVKRQRGRKVSVERKVGECKQWRGTRQCSRGDSYSFSHEGTPGNRRETRKTKRHNPPLPLRNRGHSVNLKSAIRGLRNSKKEHKKKSLQQEKCAFEEVWDLAKQVHKLKNKDKTTFKSPTKVWIMPALSLKKPEEREFAVDSGTSMHMLSTKDLSSGELETLRKSRNSTTVGTAMVTCKQTRKHRYTLTILISVQLLDDTPAVLSLGELYDEHGYSCEFASDQKQHPTKIGKKFLYGTAHFVLVVPGLSPNTNASSSILCFSNRIPMGLFSVSFQKIIQQVGDHPDFVQEELLGLQCWTKVWGHLCGDGRMHFPGHSDFGIFSNVGACSISCVSIN